jgi:hypothetical protein
MIPNRNAVCGHCEWSNAVVCSLLLQMRKSELHVWIITDDVAMQILLVLFFFRIILLSRAEWKCHLRDDLGTLHNLSFSESSRSPHLPFTEAKRTSAIDSRLPRPGIH